MSDMVERYEAEAATFYTETGVLAPGKDAPAAMGGYDADEVRHKLWRVWARAVYAEREREELRERLAAVERERDAARGDVNRWIQAALAATMPNEFGLAFDPTNPEGWAVSRRSVMERLISRAEQAERERDELKKFAALQDAWEAEAMGDITMLLKERNEYRHRAERMEAVVEAACALVYDVERRLKLPMSKRIGEDNDIASAYRFSDLEDLVLEYHRALDATDTAGDV